MLVAVSAFVACDDAGIVTPKCGEIPTGGCPVGRGDPCLDGTCRAAHRCETDGVWHLVKTCDGYVEPDASSTDAADAATVVDAPFVDAPPGAFGGPGCPLLEAPDCPLGTALACSSGCCGCEDLFVCRANAWDFVGTCDVDAGVVTR